ncbi:hypothetical protein Skr01_48860 [Sphaerisporangium krabiense]|uniref:Acyl carrier protein n=1 Tax=Sphaerisporangium krabiense TaxID=763782 RepID=A0A7W8Z267_9ACTN|nr:acyl carrier protein [Sphaerisporangium krabiense]MBB5625997.1 acyl carrier protein [Sphaerisporangium krabiense]GII64801.1 hypothetical protein Skr01_48860 [Sphaerisporangium krabiense]
MSSIDDAGSTTRHVVRDLWSRLLPEGHGTFTECGGDSLTALRLIGAVYGTYGVRMTLADLGTATDADDFGDRVAHALARTSSPAGEGPAGEGPTGEGPAR